MKLLQEDCLSGMSSIPDSSIDLVCTDPPYLINYENLEWDKAESFEEFSELWIKECFRVLKPTGTLWSCMGYQNVIPFINLLNQYGTVQLQNWSIWARSKGRGSKNQLKSLREDVVHVTKDPKNYTWNPLQIMREVIAPYVVDGRPRGWILDNETGKRIRWTGAGNVFWYSAPQWNSVTEKQFHPAQKPVMLMLRLILLSSNKGDVVLDPFMGSGTTGVACKLCDRDFIGFEKEPRYMTLAKERIESFKAEDYPEYNLWNDQQIKKYKEENDKKFKFGVAK